ncbi:MAG: glycoside hydrolase family 3 protein [Butyrivibrio sp.]|jgi:beta-N-acetylhexosaminidase|nr:glycoside hydrolase family 3 protein [Butyrivibrio sp.]
MKRTLAGILTVFALLIPVVVLSIQGTAQSEKTQEVGVQGAEDAEVTQELLQMTIQEKVAQLFFVTPQALCQTDSAVTEADQNLFTALDRYPVGGIIFFADNLQNTQQTMQLLTQIQQHMELQTGIPVFLGTDEEGGRVRRVGSNPNFGVKQVPAMGTLARQKDPEVIRKAAQTIGTYLSVLGFNVDFAPDADVITNSSNTVIGDRSFGTDPLLTARMAAAYMNGLHEEGMLCAYKHYPGHGGTQADTHKGYAYTDRTLKELAQSELVPFQDGVSGKTDFIMVSHISVPNVTGSDIPASMSPLMVQNILREKMKYNGVIITDAMNMGAVTQHYTSAQAAVGALQAGCDVILMPEDFQSAYQAVLKSVRKGTISKARLDASVSRVLKAKMNIGIKTDSRQR